MLAVVGGTLANLCEANGHGLAPGATATGVLKSLVRHTEQPATRCRKVRGDVVEAAPRYEHDIRDDVLGVGWMNTPAHEPQEINV